MNQKLKSSKQVKKQDEKAKTPWWTNLEVQDLVKPITVRRIHMLYAGLALIAMLLTGYFVWNQTNQKTSGVDLVNDMVAAAGGIEAWNGIKEGQFTRTHHHYGETGELLQTKEEIFFFRKTDQGVQLQVKNSTKDGEEVWIGKDEEGYWASKNKEAVDPKLTARGLGMMCDSKWCEPLCASSMAFYRFSMPFKLTDWGVIPNVLTNTVDDQGDILLDITFDPSIGKDRWQFSVDPENLLIEKIAYFNKSDAGDTRPEEIFWSDHREEQGITFSHKWSRYWSNGQLMDEFIYSDVDFSSPLAEEFFDRPDDHDWLTAN